MRIVLITTVTPTPDNYRAASALPYHLLKYRSKKINVIVYSFNSNCVDDKRRKEIAEDLHIEIKVIPRAKIIEMMFCSHLIFLKNFLPYPFDYYNGLSSKTLNEIREWLPDGIWIYGDSLFRFADKFVVKTVITMPDCVPFYYYRLIGDYFLFNSFYKMMGNAIQYYKNIKMERKFPSDKRIHYHLVGGEDEKFLKKINPSIQTHFIRHPHYNIGEKKEICFSKPKIKLLIAGQYNLYMKTAVDEIIPILCENKSLSAQYTITFLGKGWTFVIEKLMNKGYFCKQINYVDVYFEEIAKYDIQLTPISVGTGTKGKVLDAFANGLLVIGTPYALENIAVEHEKSCSVYSTPEELITILKDIPQNIEKYEHMAETGREMVLKYHNRKNISKELFSLFC
ncbi:MAG: glycosyltransferase [Prevotella sp.]|nr:glycosyltransferase [Prevotella sp.]